MYDDDSLPAPQSDIVSENFNETQRVLNDHLKSFIRSDHPSRKTANNKLADLNALNKNATPKENHKVFTANEKPEVLINENNFSRSQIDPNIISLQSSQTEFNLHADINITNSTRRRERFMDKEDGDGEEADFAK